MNILILGSGAREHALGWKIKQSPLVEKLFFAPGNPGTLALGENLSLDPSDHHALLAACRMHLIDLVVVGPDHLLAEGVVDALAGAGVAAFGPTKAAAEIEWSKAFAKQLMQEENIPTAESKTFADFKSAAAYAQAQSFPLVIKADGLALGKGVVVAQTLAEAEGALHEMLENKKFGEAGTVVVIEEFLEGREISVHAICAGEQSLLFPISQDHKRAFDGDEGPNTGGMGVIAPVPGLPHEVLAQIQNDIILPTLRGLAARGRAFSGLLYPGIMLTNDGPKVIEFNARFGDPEAEAYMRLVKNDLVPVLVAAARGSLEGITLEWSSDSVACVMLASGGYPGVYEKGKAITGIEVAEARGAIIFHAGTALDGQGKLTTNGGRVLGVTAVGESLQQALADAYAAVGAIHFENVQYRTDIGAKALP